MKIFTAKFVISKSPIIPTMDWGARLRDMTALVSAQLCNCFELYIIDIFVIGR